MKRTIVIICWGLVALSAFVTFFNWERTLVRAMGKSVASKKYESYDVAEHPIDVLEPLLDKETRDGIKYLNCVERDFTVGAYDAIEVSSAIRVQLLADWPADRVKVRADERVMPHLIVEVRKGKLCLDVDPRSSINPARQVVTIEVQAWDCNGALRKIEVSGTSKAEIESKLHGPQLEIGLSGASKLHAEAEVGHCEMAVSGVSKCWIDLNATTCKADVSGSSKMKLSGRAEQMELNVSGVAAVDAEAFAVGRIEVDASGVSQTRLHCTDRLEANASGVSAINYKGDCSLGKYTSGKARIGKI